MLAIMILRFTQRFAILNIRTSELENYTSKHSRYIVAIDSSNQPQQHHLTPHV